MMLSQKEGKELIMIARETISSHFSGKDINVDKALKEKFSNKLGCFVTLNINSRLRGCIGFTEPIYPLWEGIIHAAKSAAFNDPRFPQLEERELENVEIEVSVLSKPEEITAEKKDIPNNVKVGRDGLIVESPNGAGLLLPQVFTEYNANSEKALEMTCEKAGLEPKAWMNDNCKVFRFEAKVFKEA
jgi:AmmeMemoRadiSam system protein A